MNFKVGQKVKRNSVENVAVPAGAEGIITALNVYADHRMAYHAVVWSGYPCPNASDGVWNTRADCLIPITDPRADAFIESIKKLDREPRIPVTTPAFGD